MNKRIGGSDRKIDPARRKALKADGTIVDNDRVETGPTDLAFAEWAALHAGNIRCWHMVWGFVMNIRQYAIPKMSTPTAIAGRSRSV